MYNYTSNSIYLSSMHPYPVITFCLNDYRFGDEFDLVLLSSGLLLGLCL